MSKAKRKAKIKDTILKIYISIVFCFWALAMFTMDSPTWTPTIVFAVTTLLLWWFVYANKDYLQKLDEEGEE